MKQYLLGLDQGTTTCRAVLYDLEAHVLGEAYREVHPRHPHPTWAEVDPEDWWRATASVIREALEGARVDARQIVSIGLCALLHAAVPVDREGQPLARAMLWMDQRCQPQVEWMIQEHGAEIEAVMGTGRRPSTTVTAPKLRWWLENRPEIIRRTYKFLWPKDFIRYRLTGTMASDPTDAGGAFLLHPERRWATEIMNIIGVPAEKLPPMLEPYKVAGQVTSQAAQETGLAEGTPVVAGCGDTLATLIGANANQPGRGCLYIGTAAWLNLGSFSRYFAPPQARSSGQRRWSFGAAATTGATVKWFRDLVSGYPEGGGVRELLDYEPLFEEAATVEPGADGLIFLPHLMGERGLNNPYAKGVLFGLTLAHGRHHLMRAILEGSAYFLRQLIERGGEPLEEMVVVGGGAKSPLWRQIFADVTGVRVISPRILETGALGAAILAGVGIGIYPDVAEAAERLVEIVSDHPPNPRWQERYEAMYRIYRELEDRVAPLYPQVPVR
ncbi:MAG: FGGY family carbohydrate kinase [Chloroflexota bacterium]|nr:FGGY family carbohydrate kinase [Chloroflexota bacterium]